MIAGITPAEALLDAVGSDPSAPRSIAISAPGGCGKTALLTALAECHRAAGITVADVDAGPPSVPGVVLVDDAHLLDGARLEHAQRLIEAGGTSVVVAYRPWPARPEIARLAAATRRPVLHLHPLDRAEVERRATARTSAEPSPALVELLVHDAGGLPLLIDAVLESWSPSVPDGDGRDEVLDRVARILDDLDPGSRALLHAAAVGAELEDETLARVLEVPASAVGALVEATRATGLLRRDGHAVPLVAAAVLRSTPAERTRAARQRLLHARIDQRRDAVAVAQALAASGARDPAVAEVLVAAADAQLAADPDAAVDLYAAALDAGAPSGPIGVRRAEAAARAGRLDVALGLLDPVLAAPGSSDFSAAMELATTVMAHQGLLGRAGELYRWLDAERITTGRPTAALALLATGHRPEAGALLRALPPAPTTVAAVRSLVAQGIASSIDGHPSAALSTLVRATTLAESSDRSVPLADTPAALTALVALQTGDLDVAEFALVRAIDCELGGDVAAARHRILLAWVAMLRGRYASARQLIDDGCDGHRSPRDELFLRALQLGIARRTSDAPGLVTAWKAGRQALLRHPVDLFTLLPMGEFAIAAARLRESARIGAQLEEMWQLLRDLGEPVVWSALPHWCGVQAAILNTRPADVEPHATALVRAAPASPLAAALAAAGGAWMEVLVGEIDPPTVQAAARRLGEFGLTWDGSRLLGQAAAHSSDRRATATLLQMARALQGPDEADPADAPPGSDGSGAVLSGREREVAELLLQGRTYREIGQGLYIAPKTVEHHVARMKQRMGASGRSDLLTRLRALLG